MPGDLTPTEQGILEGLASGLHDAEIAVRLGLPVGDLKQRITAILQRQHLLDREALLAWYRGEAREGRYLVVNEAGPPLRMRAWFVPVVAVVAFVAGIAFTLAFTWPTDDSTGQAEPTPGSSPDAGREVEIFVVTPISLGRIEFATFPLLIGNAVTVDEGFAPIVITYPDGGALTGRPNSIDRLYVDAESGLVASEQIWEEPEDGFLYDAITNDLGTLVAVFYGDGDGGYWIEVLTVGGERLERHASDRSGELVAFLGGRVVVRSGTSLAQYYIPGNSEGFDAPGTGFGDPLGWHPATGLTWYGGEGYVLDENGEELFRLGAGITHELAPVAFGALRDDGLVSQAHMRGTSTRIDAPNYVVVDDGIALLAWSAGADTYTSLVALGDGMVLDTMGGGVFAVGGASGLRIVANYCQQGENCELGFGRPAIYSILDGRLHELAGFDGGRRLIGSQRGPFARVLPGDGCVPIRATLSPQDTTTVGCVQPGEPLTLFDLQPVDGYYPGEPTIATLDSVDHVRVLTPFGEPGWIRADAVEIGPMPAVP